MDSMQCYKPAKEIYGEKSLSSSYGLKPNSNGYYTGHSMASNQTPVYGQYPDHTLAKSQTHSYSQNQSYCPNPSMAKPVNQYGQTYSSHHTDHTMAKPYGQTYSSHQTDHNMTKTHSAQSMGQLHGYRMDHKVTDHKLATYGHGHSQHAGQYAAHGMVSHGKTKKKKEKKADCKKKEKSMTKKKYKDGNRSCSDGSSSSDSDSD